MYVEFTCNLNTSSSDVATLVRCQKSTQLTNLYKFTMTSEKYDITHDTCIVHTLWLSWSSKSNLWHELK